jgi:hypothetical protein
MGNLLVLHLSRWGIYRKPDFADPTEDHFRVVPRAVWHKEGLQPARFISRMSVDISLPNTSDLEPVH